MLSEQITVTTTPTSIRQLIATERGAELENIPENCTGILLRFDKAETAIVSVIDATTETKPGTVNPVPVLDNSEDLLATSWPQYNITQPLLACDTGTVVVNVIVTQKL